MSKVQTDTYEGPDRRRSAALPILLIVQIVLLVGLIAAFAGFGIAFREGQDADARAIVASSRAGCERDNDERRELRAYFRERKQQLAAINPEFFNITPAEFERLIADQRANYQRAIDRLPPTDCVEEYPLP